MSTIAAVLLDGPEPFAGMRVRAPWRGGRPDVALLVTQLGGEVRVLPEDQGPAYGAGTDRFGRCEVALYLRRGKTPDGVVQYVHATPGRYVPPFIGPMPATDDELEDFDAAAVAEPEPEPGVVPGSVPLSPGRRNRLHDASGRSIW